MTDKEKYFKAFEKSKGQCNEIELGASLGLDEDTTEKIITQLLAEYKIVHNEHGLFSYGLMKQHKRIGK